MNKATSNETLLDRLNDPRVSKSELEHFASRLIKDQEVLIKTLKQGSSWNDAIEFLESIDMLSEFQGWLSPMKHIESEHCWCEPTVERHEKSNLVIHNDVH